MGICFSDDHPAAEDVEYQKVENNKVEIKTKHLYKISGTQLYLDIRNKVVTADVCTGTERDKTSRTYSLFSSIKSEV